MTILADIYRDALIAIVETDPPCDECCDTLDDDGGVVARAPRRPITHETTLFGCPVYLCAEHAVTRQASHNKARSKGCGPQPEVVPRVEPAHITIARAALEAK